MSRNPHRSRSATIFRWALVVLLGVPALLLVSFMVLFSIGAHRLKDELGFWVRVDLPEGFSGCTDLRFNVPGAPPTRVEHPLYVVDLPANGRWFSSTNLNWGETLTFMYYSRTASGWMRVTPNREGGGTRSYAEGSVELLPTCFEQPLKVISD